MARGTGDQTDCSDFSSAASVYPARSQPSLELLRRTRLTNAGGWTTWNQNDAVTYRVTATLQNNTAAQARHRDTFL